MDDLFNSSHVFRFYYLLRRHRQSFTHCQSPFSQSFLVPRLSLSLSTCCDTQTRLPWISTFVFFWFSSSGVINLHTVHQHLCIVASVPSVSVSEQSTKFVTTGGEFPFGNNAENELIPTVVQQELIKRGRAVHPPAKDEEIILILLDNVQHSFLPTVRHTILAELLHHVRLMSQ